MIRTGLIVMMLLLTLAALMLHDAASAQVDPAQLRFRLVGDEPIAGPDGRTTVSGSKVLVFKDVKQGDCYVTFVLPSGSSTVSQRACPQ